MPPKALVATFSAVPAPDRHGVLVDNIIRALSVRYELDVLSLRVGELPYVDRYRRARMLRVPLVEGGLADQVEAFRRAVTRQLSSNDYDVIHLRSAWAALPVCRMRNQLDAAIILDLTLSPSTQVKAADSDIVGRTLSEEQMCLRSVDQVIVGSVWAKEHLVQTHPSIQVAVVPPGVDVDGFDWEPVPDSSRPVILYVGGIGPGRGIRMLLSAFQFVLRSGDLDAELVLIGPVEKGFRPVLDEAVVRLGLTNHVVLAGPVEHDDIPRIIAASSVCVVPTVPDLSQTPMGMCPLKMLEYLACRRPTVAPHSQLVEEILGGGDAAFLFTPNVPGDLAEALMRALTDRDAASRAAEQGYRVVRNRWTAAASRRALLDLYRRFVPYAAPLPSAVPVMSGVLPADPKTTTARRFAALHDTVVQARVAGAEGDDSGVFGEGGRDDGGETSGGRAGASRDRSDTQPLMPAVEQHPDLIAADAAVELELIEENADSARDLVEAELVGDPDSRVDVVAPEDSEGVVSRGKGVADRDTMKLSLDEVSGTIDGGTGRRR